MFHTAQYGMYAGDRSACEWGTDLKLIIEAIEGTVADVVQDKTNMTLVASNMISPVLEHYDTITKCPLSTDNTDKYNWNILLRQVRIMGKINFHALSN